MVRRYTDAVGGSRGYDGDRRREYRREHRRNTTENIGIPDEQTEDIAEAADGDTEDIALQSSEEDTETPETSEGLSSDSQEDTFGDGEESFGDASDSGESGIEYIKGRPLTEEEEQEQLAPFDNLTSYSTAVEIGNDVDEVPMGRAAAYPSYYNAADQGYVTSVKNQEPYGMCWAFGMASLLETSFLTQGLGTYDLSEEHLAYFFANRKNDPLGNTYGMSISIWGQMIKETQIIMRAEMIFWLPCF